MAIIFDKPLIGVVMCQNQLAGHPVQSVHNKYLDAIFSAGGIPLALPHGLATSPELLENSMTVLSGILLTGSPSNIEPHHYGENGSEADSDAGRDRLAFALIEGVIRQQMPLMAICRGLQELVVATGGTLHRALSDIDGLREHREDSALALEQQYAPAHEVWVEPHGLLHQLLPGCEKFWVNSLHSQGIRTPGPALRTEARAADGLIEAVSLPHHPFALAVQWHPEWQSESSALSRALFSGFIQACQRFQKERKI
ncbi:gamma-glutamyl-gamma-aminobutyrate hydrolase [Erwinia sp. OLTSP20]|uniref:gamma-glutamyl-gamma-aminobutyrate hydrolase n=1 Tax=unclassified Erwinia TaxID=2622719 RepID=UPI000C183A93|nr:MULTISPECIES: gamma-glutamyl-gamma-aminobutyrate hydrolase [unclassified Erwinia]PIJ50861.1 gamma-glutamyl-gamma-aminobutyrate hydrolase [Erwinia sp. OAMSP11]PIJ73247.1 gamma-glutamyl-gamma-aminobutyrate hydrolase [Erwinia sp. OLSSP12]PIJ82261.1 gamma-glutamyl-gamma-aminobutyrate hydrolase [Erwinia sp. OLCASP19]PIJ85413.1 gamma-glutamyl-gamma-aminobutyrate hydrolase [Erwinia sp. OLMTSP26]PIJ87110.1 gamma-glutamyl-gamma-aminobutyrate hydrolase [Erwinia sp. OLMDSP33]